MIEQLSPPTRRIVAVGLLVLALLLIVPLVVLPLAGAVADRRERLADLRAERAHLQARARRLLPDASTMPLGLTIAAPDAAQAGSRLAAYLSGAATVAGVAVTVGPPHPSPGGGNAVTNDVTAAGSETAVMAFVSLVEHGAPAIRFSRWDLSAAPPAPGSETGARFAGTATAAWQPQ